MSSSPQAALTIGQHLPWVNMTLDYLDKLAALIPEEMLDFRPVDPNGHFMLSLAEIVMHSSDERFEFARQLANQESNEGMYALWYHNEPGAEPVEGWAFKPYGGKQALLDSLRNSRLELQPWLDLPVDQLHNPTEGTSKSYQETLAAMTAQGADTSGLEARGAATINRVLFALCVHEAGHRGTLQTLLRLNGVDARGEE